ncbi:NosD domain-containing protein [Bacillus solimangrovi]|uniref:Periplasmic copper-binding protein NosD beta helix domain-containing protein n=1 Tax=Bacillus solimangrovi TaxID=1305675 RepID=A0A1E5LI45_9BACI|nr:NosD domain-containing protein [Bacillus solimangrovi]OEH93750.1 hypothetical protein BFG57_11230 [Bacillus solimangrovi]
MSIIVVPTDFATVQDAIDDPGTMAGDTIEILVGTFAGFNVTVDRLKIVGCGIGKTIINGTSGAGTSGVSVSAIQTHLEGFTVQGFNSGNGVEINSANNVIQEVESSFNNVGFAVLANDNFLTKNSATFNQSTGFDVESSFNCLVENISTNNIDGFVMFDSENTLVENLAKNNRGAGFLLEIDANENTLQGNSAIKNDVGIDINSDDNKVKDNKTCDNTSVGIRLIGPEGSPSGNDVDSNVVRKNGTVGGLNNAGIFVVAGSGTNGANTIRFNKATGNNDLDIEAQGGIGNNNYDGNKCDISDPNTICM